MKRAARCLVLLLAACPSGDDGPKMVPLPPESVARLVSKDGVVTLTRAATRVDAAPGPLLEHDVLTTGAQSRALVRAVGGREIELGENTEFKLGKSLGDIEVGNGTITFVADDLGDGGVTQITTKYGRTTVAPGTRASVALREGGLTVDVSFGTIVQIEEDGGTQSVGAGQKLEFGIGKVQMIDEPSPGAPLEVTLLAEGKVLLKKKGETRFSAAKKNPIAVGEGTAVQVGNGARARLSVPGVTAKLGAGVTGSVDLAGVNEDGNAVGLTTNGAVALAFDGKTPAAVTLGGKNPIKVKGKGESAATVTKGRVDVLVGELELEVNGKKQVVKAGEAAVVSAKGVEVAARARPSLLLPIGKKVRVYSRRGVGEVALALPDEVVRAQVASDAEFNEVVVSGPSKDFVAVPAPQSGELFWRTLDDKGEPKEAGRVRFLPDVGSAKDEASRGDTVTETGKTSVFFQGAVPTLTFTFTPVEGAKGYLFRIYRGSDKKVVVEKKVNEPKVTVEPGVLTEGSYQWLAAGLDEAGNEKSGGRPNQINIIYDNSLTTLQIATPKDGDRSEGAKLSGTAPLNAKLFVNGKGVPLDGSGRFSAAAPKAELLVFRLVGSDGSESYWFRRLKR